jgi:hypothetical protein
MKKPSFWKILATFLVLGIFFSVGTKKNKAKD